MATDHAMNGSDPTSVIYDWTSTVSVNYGPVDAGFGADGSARFVTLTNRLAGDDDALAVAAFFLTDAETTTVGGKPAVMGTTDALQGFGTASIVWLDGDDVVNLSASESMGDIAALAETVRRATEAEWDELDAETKANQERQQAIQEEASRTWFIDAGDLDDSTTWLAEGTFDEAGAFLAAASEMSGNGSSFGNGSGIGSGAAEIPSLQLQTSGSLSSIVFALGPLDRPDAVLRVTLDDGTVLERPLHEVRPDWPALAAAIGYDNSRSGTAELVTADGTVLDRLALDAAPGQPGARGTDVTVAAASG